MVKIFPIFGIALMLLIAAVTNMPWQLTDAQLQQQQDPIVQFYPEEQVARPTESDVTVLQQTALQKLRSIAGPASYQDMWEAAAVEDGDGHGFRITIPQNWVADTWTYIDDLVTDPTNGDLESRAGMLFGAKAASLANEGKFEKAVICIQGESEPEIGGSIICNIERTTGIVIISKYEDVETIPLFQQIVGLGRNITVDDLVAYHFKLKSENPFARTWGFDYQIRNMTDMQVNLTDATTNQTKTTIPAKFVEYTHSDNTYQQLGKAPDLTHMLFAVYDDPGTGEVTGFDIEFKTAKYNASNFPGPGMFMQQFFLAGELKEIFNSFAIVKASTGTATTTDLTTSTEDYPSVEEGSETAATATSTTTQEEEDGGDTECDSSYPDDCIPPPPPNLNCDDEGVPENFQVVGSDPHGFDGDNDGIGCESGNNQPEAGEEEEDDGGDGGDGGGGADDDGGDGGDEGEGGGEGNDPNEFEGCIVPPGRDLSDAGC